MTSDFIEKVEQCILSEDYEAALALLERVDVYRIDMQQLKELKAIFNRISKPIRKTSRIHSMQQIIIASREGKDEITYWFNALLALRDGLKDSKNNAEKELINNTISLANIVKQGGDNGQLLLSIAIACNEIGDTDTGINLSPTTTRPSVLNGSKDLSEWGKNYKAVSSILSPIIKSIFPVESKAINDCAVAELLYLKNDIKNGMLYVAASVSSSDPEIKFAAGKILADIYSLDKSSKSPTDVLELLGDNLREDNALWLMGNYQAVLVENAIREGNLQLVRDWMSDYKGSEMDRCCNGNIVEMTALLHSFIAVGRYKEAVVLSENLLNSMGTALRPIDRISFLLDSAVAAKLLGSDKSAFDKLDEAIKLANNYGYVRLFADRGPVMFSLLMEYADRCTDDGLISFIKSITEATKEFALLYPSLYAKVESENELPELTQTEVLLLHLLDEGKSNQQIADKLKISVSTVKFHLRNLFEKLGADSRAEVVSIGNKKGILG